jgi:hypothetical protein
LTIEYRYDIINLSNEESEDLQIMMEQMTLNELKTGMHVVTRDGGEYIVLKDTCCGDKGNDDYYADVIIGIPTVGHTFTGLSNYRTDMTNKMKLTNLDIVAVYSCDSIIYVFESIKDKPQAFTQIYAEEEPITRAEAEKLLGRKIVD